MAIGSECKLPLLHTHKHTHTHRSFLCQVPLLTVPPTALNGKDREKRERLKERRDEEIDRKSGRLSRGKVSSSGETSLLICSCRRIINASAATQFISS